MELDAWTNSKEKSKAAIRFSPLNTPLAACLLRKGHGY